MDVFLILVLFLQLILETVCGYRLCSTDPTPWNDGIRLCLRDSGRPLSFSEFAGVSIVSTEQVWTADFFDTSYGENKLCRFVYRNSHGLIISSGDLLCTCTEQRNYICRNNSDSLVILNGNWTSAKNCGSSDLSDIQSWKEGYYWITYKSYKGFLGKVTNDATFSEPGPNFYCGMYEDDVVSYFRGCDQRRVLWCYFDTLPNQPEFYQSCYNLATTTKPLTSSVKLSQTITPTTSASGNAVTRHQDTSKSPVTEISQVTEGSSPTGITAVENVNKNNPKETKQTDIATAAWTGFGLGLALIGALVALILIQKRYGCIRCTKSFKDRQSTGEKSVHAIPAYDITDDLHYAHFNTKTKSLSLIKRSKYECVRSAKTKEDPDMLSGAQNTEYSFPKSKTDENTNKENEYDTTRHVRKAPPTDETVYNRTYTSDFDENVYNKTNAVCRGENVYNRMFTPDLDENVYNKTNGVCRGENVYNKADTNFGENVYNTTFERNISQVQVALTNEYGSPKIRDSGERQSDDATSMSNSHNDNVYNDK